MNQSKLQVIIFILFSLGAGFILFINAVLFAYLIFKEKPTIESQEICMSVRLKDVQEKTEIELPSINPQT